MRSECFRKAAALGYAPGATWLGTVSKGGAAEFFRSAADAGQAELAGILHDVMKEQDDEVLLRYLSVPEGTGVEDPADLHAP